jgi:hypothetical protein
LANTKVADTGNEGRIANLRFQLESGHIGKLSRTMHGKTPTARPVARRRAAEMCCQHGYVGACIGEVHM